MRGRDCCKFDAEKGAFSTLFRHFRRLTYFVSFCYAKMGGEVGGPCLAPKWLFCRHRVLVCTGRWFLDTCSMNHCAPVDGYIRQKCSRKMLGDRKSVE